MLSWSNFRVRILTQFSSKMYLLSTRITEILEGRKETWHSPWNLIDLAAALPPMYANKLARNPANDQWIPDSKDTLPLLPYSEDPRGKTESANKMRSSSIHLLQQARVQSQGTVIPAFAYSWLHSTITTTIIRG
jgi:hypothetical protein